MAETAFVRIPRTNERKNCKFGRIDPAKVALADFFYERCRRTDRDDVECTAGIGLRADELADLWSGESDCAVREEDGTRRGYAIGGESGRSVDRENQRWSWSGAVPREFVDVGDSLRDDAGGSAAQAGAEESVDDNGAVCEFGPQTSPVGGVGNDVDGITGVAPTSEIGGGFAAKIFGFGEEYYTGRDFFFG